MFEAYAIGVTLKLNNLVSPQLVLLSKETKELDGLFLSANSTLRKMGEGAAGLRGVTSSMNATARATERAAASAAILEKHLEGIKAAGALPGAAPGVLPSGGGTGGGGGRRNYRGGMHGGNVHMGPGGVGISTVGMSAGDAFVPLAITAGMVWAGHSMYESAKDLNTEMTRFKLFGLGDKLNNEAFKFVQGMHIYGTTQAENMKSFREAQGVFRESGLNDSSALEGAKLAAPVLAKIAFATAALDEESQARMRTSSMAMLRWVEMSGGLKDAATFNRLADFGWKMVQTSGGTVDWEQLRQFKATSGVSGRFISDEGMAALEPIMAELKGGRTGTSLVTAFGRLSGIVRLPNQAAHELVKGGIWDQSKVIWNSQGGIKSFKGNPFTSSSEFQSDPVKWYEKHMIPMYDAMKITQEQRARKNSMLFGRTGGALFSLIEYALPKTKQSVEAQRKAFGINASVNQEKQSLGGQEQEFTSAWTDFKTQFGIVALPQFTGMLKGATFFLRAIGDFMSDHKEGLKLFSMFTSPTGLPTALIKGLFGLHDSIESVKPAAGGSNDLPSVIQLVPTQGGRPLAEYNAKNLAKHQFTHGASGTFDLNVAQPSVNLRTN